VAARRDPVLTKGFLEVAGKYEIKYEFIPWNA
jgi:hypothetical protein